MKNFVYRFWYKFSPFLIGIVASLLYLKFFDGSVVPNTIERVLGGTLTLSAIFIGFLSTSLSIILSIDERYIVKQLKNTSQYKSLINLFLNTIRLCFVLLFISLGGLFIDFANYQIWHNKYIALWLAILLFTILSLYRIIALFAKILKT